MLQQAVRKGDRFSKLIESTSVHGWAINAALLFLVFFAGMAAVQYATPNMPDNDGFYHIRFAELMREQSLKPDFPWLPLTVLNSREFSDHHFLFHVALIPFTFGDLRMGAKAAAVIFASLAFLSVWMLLRSQKVPYAALWSLGLLAVSEAFIYRMSITRAQSLSLAVLVIGLYLMFTQRYRWLIPLAFFYVWFYDAFPLLFIQAGIFTLASWMIDKKIEARPLIYVGLGTLLGLLINPYFPDNLIFFLRHVAPKLVETTNVSVGNEWYPYATKQLLENSPLALVAFLSGTLALGLRDRRMDAKIATSFFSAVFYGLLLFQSRRFIEYFPPYALIFAALAWTPLMQNLAERATLRFSWKERQYPIASLAKRWLVAGILVIFLLPGIGFSLDGARSSIRSSKPYTFYEEASHWLMENTLAGTRVFQSDWDDFPRLFFYNTQNSYLIGLDPTYMQLYDDDLYDLWVKITRGEVVRPSEYIFPRFGAEYVLTDLKHGDLIRRADKDPGLAEVYRDTEAVIYRVNE
jgi:hypothetical protein